MARPKPRRPLPEMQPHTPQASHHSPGAPSERAWEEPNGIMAQCIAIGDHLVAAAKRTERALRAIGVALTDGEHQFDGPGPDQQADKAEYQRIAEAMFNSLTSDLFPMSAARNASWRADDDADRYSEQMEPPRTDIDMDEHLSYLSDDDDDQHSDVASASDMPLFADDVDVVAPSAPPSAPPSLPDTHQTTLADEQEPEQEHEPALLNAQKAAEEETLVAASVPAKKRGKKKKKKAAKAKRTELEQTVVNDANQMQAEPTDLDLLSPQNDADDEVTHGNHYENTGEQDGRSVVEYEPSSGHGRELSHARVDAGIDEIIDKLRDATMSPSQVKGLSIIAGMYKSLRELRELDPETRMTVRTGLEQLTNGLDNFLNLAVPLAFPISDCESLTA